MVDDKANKEESGEMDIVEKEDVKVEEKEESSEKPAPKEDKKTVAKTYDEYVIVVDDSKPNRQIVSVLLKSIGLGALEYEDGQHAWEALEKEKDKKIIAIFSDIMMPRMSGVELLAKVRGDENLKSLPVVLITANPAKEFVIDAKQNQVNGFIIKPISQDKVLETMQKLFPDKKLKRKL